MGMYDYINGEQVKCFGVACYYGDRDGVSPMGGILKSFNTGNKVPYKTKWYNFTKNFVVVDNHPFEEEDYMIFHVIKDGKVFGTFKFNDITNDILKDFDVFVDYWGERLTIRTKEDAEMYKEDLAFWQKERLVISSKSHAIFQESMELWRSLRDIDKDSEEYIEKKKRVDELLEEKEKQEKLEEEPLEILRNNKVSPYFDKKYNSKEYHIYRMVGLYLEAEAEYSKRIGMSKECNEIRGKLFALMEDEYNKDCYCKYGEITKRKLNNLLEKIKLKTY